MAGRKPIFNREEQRKNQVVVPMSHQEKKRVQDAASAEDRSVASFVLRSIIGATANSSWHVLGSNASLWNT